MKGDYTGCPHKCLGLQIDHLMEELYVSCLQSFKSVFFGHSVFYVDIHDNHSALEHNNLVKILEEIAV